MEEWKDIQGYEGLYQVSNLGKVMSLERVVIKNTGVANPIRAKLKALVIDNSGYFKVNLYKMNKLGRFSVHRLVGVAFIPNPENKPCINHKNHNIYDNASENLEWCTHSENNMAQYKTPRKTTSLYKGVFCAKKPLRKKWVAYITLKSKTYRLGYFATEVEAASAYNTKAKELFGGFAVLNRVSNV